MTEHQPENFTGDLEKRISAGLFRDRTFSAKRYLIGIAFDRLTMTSLSLALEREFDDYVTIRRLNQWYL